MEASSAATAGTVFAGLMAGTFGAFALCALSEARHQGRKARRAREREERHQQRIEAARKENLALIAPLGSPTMRVTALRKNVAELLAEVVQVERDFARELELDKLNEGQEAVAKAAPLSLVVTQGLFRYSLVVYAFTETLQLDSIIERQALALTATMSHSNQIQHTCEGFTQVDATLRKLNAQLENLKQVGKSIVFAIKNRKVDNASVVVDEMRRAMRVLAHLVEPSNCIIRSPDATESLSALVGRGQADSVWGSQSVNFDNLRNRALACMPSFTGSNSQTLLGPEEFYGSGELPPMYGLTLFRTFPAFFCVYWVVFFGIFSSWVAQIFLVDDVEDLNPAALGFGGFGVTMFDVPPQYADNNNLLTIKAQKRGIPIVYAFMHCALFSLGVLPLTMMRGLIRDVTRCWPRVSYWVPVNHFVQLHKYLGAWILILLSCGATTWMLTMLVDCINGVDSTCKAFGEGQANFYNPLENVMMLRYLVWGTWMPILPLMFWANKRPKWVNFIGPMRRNWYEIVYYAHIFVAYSTLILALVARFFVFWPMLISWTFYFLDRFRETYIRPVKLVLKAAQTFAREGEPVNSLRLIFEPTRTCCRSKSFPTHAGQWVYIKVPQVDSVWHPFSLSQESRNDLVELHIGIRFTSDDKKNHPDAIPKGKFPDKTWTYKLYKTVERSSMSSDKQAEVTALVRGPYGSNFHACYDGKYGGAVVIGLGTGLTAAESVLRESFRRRREDPDSAPRKTWFVWSSSSLDDICWIYERLLSLIVDAIESNVLNKEMLGPGVQLFDWLGIAIMISQAKPNAIKEFRDFRKQLRVLPSMATTKTWISPSFVKHASSQHLTQVRNSLSSTRTRTRPEVHYGAESQNELCLTDVLNAAAAPEASIESRAEDWLLSRIFEGSVDLPSTHILRYLRGARHHLDMIGLNNKDLAVGFCGRSEIIPLVSRACTQIEIESKGSNRVSFVADHQ